MLQGCVGCLYDAHCGVGSECREGGVCGPASNSSQLSVPPEFQRLGARHYFISQEARAWPQVSITQNSWFTEDV